MVTRHIWFGTKTDGHEKPLTIPTAFAAEVLKLAGAATWPSKADQGAGFGVDGRWHLDDEHDEARMRGEVAKRGWESGVHKHNTTTSADLGLRRGRIHDARLNRRWC